MSTSGRAGGGDARPHVDGAEAFQALKTGEEKKPIVQRLEREVVAGRRTLTPHQREQCAVSPWDLDRVVLYLVDEHDKDHYDYPDRLLHVRHEVERVRTRDFEASLMPLSYALGAFLELLTDRPKYVNELRKDARLFSEFLEDLRDNPHLDEKGQVKRDLAAILGLVEPAEPNPARSNTPTGAKPRNKALEFWKSLPAFMQALAVLLPAATAGYFAFFPKPDPGPKRMLLVVQGVQLFPARNDASVQVIVTVDGTPFVYPSGAGVDWLPVGPGMQQQSFPLWEPRKEYRVRVQLKLKTGAVTEDFYGLDERFVTQFPFADEYTLQPRRGGGTVRALVSYTIERNPHLQLDSASVTPAEAGARR